jgi:hypothetical protein
MALRPTRRWEKKLHARRSAADSLRNLSGAAGDLLEAKKCPTIPSGTFQLLTSLGGLVADLPSLTRGSDFEGEFEDFILSPVGVAVTLHQSQQ